MKFVKSGIFAKFTKIRSRQFKEGPRQKSEFN